MTVSRAQAHALEAFVAATVLLASVTFALQVTAVTPLTASTSSQHIENQQAAVADGILTAAAENGTLKRTVLFTHPENGSFYDSGAEGYYVDGGPPTSFGAMLDQSFLERGIAFNVYVHYLRDREVRRTTRLVYMGDPSDHAVSRTRLVSLDDNDTLYKPGTGPGGADRAVRSRDTLRSVDDAADETYFVQDGSSGPLYALVNVEVVVWRM
ncbi:hypothetical protein HFX_1168 [Haloferax mediterranei ATCC 33500]|uniref:Uncharacterized protein n=1 Tax=Haloferax mediterranei (strain ATCC 33500 / DSM 1411 / JCM 8866 / NBRC 14739 / NCIMB 2177 / R-4) TaxID=523841 RepID=I3R3S2_HALMT|nr:hypothetical protein HFX_1168 [Haloferax mediterranei ATCC 33500]